MSDYKLKAHFKEEDLRKYYFEYSDALEDLKKDFIGFVAKLDPKTTPEGEAVSLCNWTDFIPTIMPVVDYVTIIVTGNNIVNFYIIEQTKLLELITSYVEKKDYPVKHIMVEDLEFNEEVLKRVLDNSMLLRTIDNT